MLSLRFCLSRFAFLVAAFITIDSAYATLAGFDQKVISSLPHETLNLDELPFHSHNYRTDMRDNLLMLIRYAKQQNPDFKILVHDGQDLFNKNFWEYSQESNKYRPTSNSINNDFLSGSKPIGSEPEEGSNAYEYLQSIDAIAVNNVYCGNGKFDIVSTSQHIDLIAIEHCPSEEALTQALINAMADKRAIYAFKDINQAFNSPGDYKKINDSSKNINQVSDARNILILNDDHLYSSAADLVDNLKQTNYDIIVIKPLFAYKQRFSSEDLQKLHFKKNGAKRLLIAELNIAEANRHDYYWQPNWKIGSPDWLYRQSFTFPDGVIVTYWDLAWKKIISHYFKDIINEGFDGVFFTGLENYLYFEQNKPLE